MKKNYIAPATREVKMRNRISLLAGTTGGPLNTYSVKRLNNRGFTVVDDKIMLGDREVEEGFWGR